MRSPIYLDYAATTPVDPQVAACLQRHLTLDGIFGNPSSSTHQFGQQAAQAVTAAREQVADLIHAHPDDLIWTSGATEANNLALFGVMRSKPSTRRHVVTAQTEHKAILDVCRRLEGDGCAVTYLAPDADGRLPLSRIAAALRPETRLLSLMHVNNETGVIHDIAAIAALTRERGVLLHVDAAQSAGKVPLDLAAWQVDLLSLSAHKLYGPKGIGALYVRRFPLRVRLEPLLYGGGQERGLRAGTLPTQQIAAMGEAFRIAKMHMTEENQRITDLRERLWQGLAALGGVTRNGHAQHCVAGILNVSFSGITAEALLADLPQLALATGSACTSADAAGSHVLRAMGCAAQQIRAALRFSLGRFTTLAEIDAALDLIRTSVERLRAISPLWP